MRSCHKERFFLQTVRSTNGKYKVRVKRGRAVCDVAEVTGCDIGSARRIVDCLNMCRDVPDKSLHELVTSKDLLSEVET